ncbi:hypothetical protein MKX01_038212 [Papaver californicum]|nr:hypothetical protein MKX01_038212 [Papaver californicum]
MFHTLLNPNGFRTQTLFRPQPSRTDFPIREPNVPPTSNAHLDSYILSESSFFVYPYKMIIKTCGTTKLLLSIPPILELANTLSLTVRAVNYTRGNFIFPGVQTSPHRSFSEEVAVLDSQFIKLGLQSSAYVMGADESQNWHVYSAYAEATGDQTNPNFTLEMRMTGLNKECASVFYKTESSTANEMTKASGIRKILPDSSINDFEFDPCGYSMNGIEGPAISTIHVTPEDGFSYANFEAAGYDLKNAVDLKQLVSRVLACFEPNEFSVAVHADIGYSCGDTSLQELEDGGSVVYQSFVNVGSCGSPRSILNSCWRSEDEEDSE